MTFTGRAMQTADNASVAAAFRKVAAAVGAVANELNGSPNNLTVRLRDQADATTSQLDSTTSPKAARSLVDSFLARNATLIVDATEQYKLMCPELRDDAPL